MNRGEDIVYCAQIQDLDKLPDVLRIATPGGECFHRKQMLREAADTRSPGWSNPRDAAGSPLGATWELACSFSHHLRQAKLGRYGQCLPMDNAVEVCDHAAPGEPLAEAACAGLPD